MVGGIYYEGDHPYNIGAFLASHPEARLQPESVHGRDGVCPLHPAYLEWLSKGLRWLFSEFEIGGVNLENGDFLVCIDPRCRAHKELWPKEDPDFFRFQAMSYIPAVEAIADRLETDLVTYATYTGFLPGVASWPTGTGPHMHCERPAMLDRLPRMSIAQWNLKHMLFRLPLPLVKYLDDGAPPEAFSHFIHWPEDTLRNFGRTTLGQVLGGEDEGVAFVELMARWDGGLLTEEDRRDLRARVGALRRTVAQGSAESLERWRFWNWLDRMCRGIVERHTVSFV